jgi:myo-inositol-1(or 4)-monophosphatase
MVKHNLDELLFIAISAATDAAEIANKYIDDAGVLYSLEKDIKTLADKEVNNIILKHLSPTNIPIFSEENDSDITSSIPNTCWIIDPIDGTYNFTRKYPLASISIAFWHDNMPQIGVVLNIFNSEIFVATLNTSATLNGLDISVSNIDKISNSLLATGFPSGSSYHTDDLFKIVRKVQAFKKVRMIGAASLMLSYVAKGVFDVYYEKGIYIWDVAAGLVLVKQAGGEFILKPTSDPYKFEVLASNKLIILEAKEILIS